MTPKIKYRGTIERKRFLTHDIVELRIKLIEPETIDFVAGQFIRLDSKKYDHHEPTTRTYSVSSPPSDKNHIELIIRLVPAGIVTTWVFNFLSEGEEITFSGAYGKFCLSDSMMPNIFIAGGSGMSAIWSIVRDMTDKNIVRKTYYFFGAVTQRDLYFIDELNRISSRFSWFTFVPALSNEPPDSGWNGERGLITDVVKRYFTDTTHFEAYLCGSSGMINACIECLTRAGMPGENIFFDKFA
jgi:Na+-transporting NADH:ubiquinone oxidoreductase subunit F